MTSAYSTSSSLGSIRRSKTTLSPAQIDTLPVRYKSQRVRAQVYEPDESFDTLRRRRREHKASTSSKDSSPFSTHSLGRTRPKTSSSPYSSSSSNAELDREWNSLIERRKEYKSRYKNLKHELDEATARLEGGSRGGVGSTAHHQHEAAARTRSNELKDIADNVDRLMAKTKHDLESFQAGAIVKRSSPLSTTSCYPMSSATLTATVLASSKNRAAAANSTSTRPSSFIPSKTLESEKYRSSTDRISSSATTGKYGSSKFEPETAAGKYDHSTPYSRPDHSKPTAASTTAGNYSRFKRDISPVARVPSELRSSRYGAERSEHARKNESSTAVPQSEGQKSNYLTSSTSASADRAQSSKLQEKDGRDLKEKNAFHQKTIEHADIRENSHPHLQFPGELSNVNNSKLDKDRPSLELVSNNHFVITSFHPQLEATKELVSIEKEGGNKKRTRCSEVPESCGETANQDVGSQRNPTLCCPDPKLCRFDELTSDLFRPRREKEYAATILLTEFRLPCLTSQEVLLSSCQNFEENDRIPVAQRPEINPEIRPRKAAQTEESIGLGSARIFEKSPEFDRNQADAFLAINKPVGQSFNTCLECVGEILMENGSNDGICNDNESDKNVQKVDVSFACDEAKMERKQSQCSAPPKVELDRIENHDDGIGQEGEEEEEQVDDCLEQDDWEYYSDQEEEEPVGIEAKKLSKSFGIPAGLLTRWNIWDQDSDSGSEYSEDVFSEMSPYNSDPVSDDQPPIQWIVTELRDWLDKIVDPDSPLFYDLNDAYLQDHPIPSTLPKKKTLTGSLKRSKKKTKEGFRKEVLDPDPDLSLDRHLEAHYCQGIKHGFYRELGGEPGKKSSLFALGNYFQGRNSGSVRWKGLTGGGYLVGPVNEDNLAVGQQVYLYPDLSHCIQGEFESGKMMEISYASLF